MIASFTSSRKKGSLGHDLSVPVILVTHTPRCPGHTGPCGPIQTGTKIHDVKKGPLTLSCTYGTS